MNAYTIFLKDNNQIKVASNQVDLEDGFFWFTDSPAETVLVVSGETVKAIAVENVSDGPPVPEWGSKKPLDEAIDDIFDGISEDGGDDNA